MDTQDPDMIRLAVQGLFARYRSEAEPTLMQGGSGAVSSGGVLKVQRNSLLRWVTLDTLKTPFYRQAVVDKLAKSSLF